MVVMAFFNSQFSSSIFEILLIISAMLASSTFEPVDTCARPMSTESRAEEDGGGREDDEEEDRGRRGDADED